ncbi:MAG: serine protease, partial [Clostridia bacterium]|nr:serine protease [Clostridia bacterium]
MDDAEGIFVSAIDHAARVTVDEEGVTAAAFTEIALAGGAAAPSDEVDITLDRPFLFVITGINGTPLFAGTVCEP